MNDYNIYKIVCLSVHCLESNGFNMTKFHAEIDVIWIPVTLLALYKK